MKSTIALIIVLSFFAVTGFSAENQENSGRIAPPDLLQEDEVEEDYQDAYFDSEEIYDPIEPVNRVFFEFNDKLYFWVLKPVKTGYSYVVPTEIRESFGNFFNNLSSPIRLFNNLLQGRFEDAGIVVSRFLINSTAGVYGFADVALQEYNLEPRLADFGQTLGKYGIGEGIYVVWPVLGPSNLRHTTGLVGDSLANPTFYLDFSTGQSVIYYSLNRVNNLSLSPNIYEDLKKYSLDPYVATRQAFYDFRRNFIKGATGEETSF